MAPPFLIDEVLTTLRALPRAAVWEGVRGEPGADLDEFARLACRFGDLMLATSGIVSVDLNPVLVGEPGEGALIADVLIERCPA